MNLTDLEILKILLDRAGIVYTIKEDDLSGKFLLEAKAFSSRISDPKVIITFSNYEKLTDLVVS